MSLKPPAFRVRTGPALAPYADDIRVIRCAPSRGARPPTLYCPPSLLQFMQISLGKPSTYLHGDSGRAADWGRSYAGGPDLTEGFLRFPREGAADLEISFPAWGALPAFGLSAEELLNGVAPIDAILGEDKAELLDRVCAAPNDRARVAAVEEVLTRRFRGRPQAPPALRAAVLRLYRAEGALRVEELAHEVGVTRQHLNRLFRLWLGVGAKTAAGVLRFRRVVRLFARGKASDWADAAAACGYCDQSHMIRAFHRFAGTSPERFLARLADADGLAGRMPEVPFVQ